MVASVERRIFGIVPVPGTKRDFVQKGHVDPSWGGLIESSVLTQGTIIPQFDENTGMSTGVVLEAKRPQIGDKASISAQVSFMGPEVNTVPTKGRVLKGTGLIAPEVVFWDQKEWNRRVEQDRLERVGMIIVLAVVVEGLKKKAGFKKI